ncbi:MBL fold metallo-hydrolase [Paenibacillaceae bacterium]|nr:MBL fold metallo-hydrolase [Paenibacillaceae bacterium]
MTKIQKEQATSIWCGDWIQVKSPLPFSLKWVNSYLIPGDGGYTLIDPGLHTPEAVQAWRAVLEQFHIKWHDIAQIVLTHQHPDHYGLAGWFQERTEAPVVMSRLAHNYARRLWGGSRQFDQALTELFGSHGMPEQMLQEIDRHLLSFVSLVSPQPVVQYLDESDGKLVIGDAEWQTIPTPGHASGHLCFYERKERRMFCGDQVLPDITPNISLLPGDDPNPLHSFLQSLELLGSYDVELAFPGHRDPFMNFTERTVELRRHHDRRLERISAWLQLPLNAFEVCIRMFGERVAENAHHLRFAMAETLAHLHYLHVRGSLRTEMTMNGTIQYQTTK